MGEHKLTLEGIKGELEPIGDGKKTPGEEELDLLSEIIKKMNEVYGIELSEEHRINFSRVTNQVYQSGELDKVMKGENSEQNKIKKVEEILKTVLLGYVNDQFDFYQKMENPQLIKFMTGELYRNYGKSL